MMDLSRRSLLLIGGASSVAAAATLSSCGLLSTDPAVSSTDDGPTVDKGKEAPMLAERVEQGDLPPVQERLPPDPMVIDPVDSIGVYGGEWKTMINGPEDLTWLDRTVGYEPLVRWDPGFNELIPNLAATMEPNDDGTEYLLQLQSGVKWSDGEPFTADDVVYTQNDVRNHAELGSGDDIVRAEKVSAEVVRFVSEVPNALLPHEWAAGWFVPEPKHYVKQFHPDYNDEIDTEDGSWVDEYALKSSRWENSELPSLGAWVTTSALGQDGVEVERNPYYWKVDPDGSQLPYIDRVNFAVVASPDVMVLRTTDGQVGMHVRHFNTAVNKPVLARAREEGDFDFFDAPTSWMNTMVIALNLVAADKQLAQVFNNKDFRIGLSHAINRPEIITAIYQRTGEPWQAAPRPEADFYHERLAKQYTEYDPERANSILDRAGFDKRDGNGFRLGPNGKKISFPLMAKSDETDMVATLEVVRENWKAVGIDMRVDAVDATLKFEREMANQHLATTHTGDGGWNDAWIDPRWYVPMQPAESKFALPWAQWFDSNGAEGTKPPSNTPAGRTARRQLEVYQQITSTTDEKEQNKLMAQLLDIAADTFWVMGISLPAGGYGVVANNFHNVPETVPDAWIYPTPGPSRPEQYFIRN